MLFGGEDGSGYRSDTWLWDGTTWTEETIAEPPIPRSSHAMSQSQQGRVVIFGGASGSLLNDTFELRFAPL